MTARLQTKLTRRLGITHPVIQAPMALAAGGTLAAAVSKAGGLGLIGGGYADTPASQPGKDWIDDQFRAAGNARVGCGFITWALAERPERLAVALAHSPSAMMLSFGDVSAFAAPISDAGIPLIMQVQTMDAARQAIDAGAAVIVAQGSEAGGHGAKRATMTLVPEIASLVATTAPDVCVVAAGGIADGRGLAAALMLGADGVLCGSRFWASREAIVHANMLHKAIAADGDATIRSRVMDIARNRDWPSPYTARVLRNDFTDRWHGDEDALRAEGQPMRDAYASAWTDGDTDMANVFVGEATGMIDAILPAGDIVTSMLDEAVAALSDGQAMIGEGS